MNNYGTGGFSIADIGASLGGIGAILAIFWVIAGFLLPFLVWGIYNQTHRSARELTKLRKVMELQTAMQSKAAGLPPIAPKKYATEDDPARNM